MAIARRLSGAFWRWYTDHYLLSVGLAMGLFVLQIIHLYWLGADVISSKLFGQSFFGLEGMWRYIIIALDYTEIPSLISVSLIYIYELRKRWSAKSVLYLIFLNSQWLHLFWITDEFVIETLVGGSGTVLPAWLTVLAIAIDYLELPVIYDTFRKFMAARAANLTKLSSYG